jgi:CMP/dCMP kinase
VQIAIDGPAGAGKSSVAREVARRLGLVYLDTGAMYRAITLKALNEGVDVNDGKMLSRLTKNCKLEVVYDDSLGNRILMDGNDITEEIRAPRVNQNVSLVAKSSEVRKELVHLQQAIAKKTGGIIMEGRDIGTNVLTDAPYKFFLSADVEERARRRWVEMKEKNVVVPFQDLLEEIAMRDRIDQERDDAPLRAAPDACVIDTTSYSFEEVVQKLLEMIRSAPRDLQKKSCSGEVR